MSVYIFYNVYTIYEKDCRWFCANELFHCIYKFLLFKVHIIFIKLIKLEINRYIQRIVLAQNWILMGDINCLRHYLLNLKKKIKIVIYM